MVDQLDWQKGRALEVGTRAVFVDLYNAPTEESTIIILPDDSFKVQGRGEVWPNPTPAKTASEYIRWAIGETAGWMARIDVFTPDGRKLSRDEVLS